MIHYFYESAIVIGKEGYFVHEIRPIFDQKNLRLSPEADCFNKERYMIKYGSLMKPSNISKDEVDVVLDIQDKILKISHECDNHNLFCTAITAILVESIFDSVPMKDRPKFVARLFGEMNLAFEVLEESLQKELYEK
jgi:hypothetical protein